MWPLTCFNFTAVYYGNLKKIEFVHKVVQDQFKVVMPTDFAHMQGRFWKIKPTVFKNKPRLKISYSGEDEDPNLNLSSGDP